MSTYQSEQEGTKQKIILAAKKEFADKGFSGARMSSIAKTAGVNQALIHYYFSSKINIYINIFQKLMGSHFEKYIKLLNDEFESWNTTPDIKLCGILYAMINGHLYVHDEEFHRIVLHEIAEGKGVIYEHMKHYMQPLISNLLQVIKDGIDQGVFETSDPVLLSIKYISFISHITHRADFFKGDDNPEEIYPGKNVILYDFITELVFKELRPSDKELIMPVLYDNKKRRINSLLEEMKNDINIF